jgi:hypothetical protein
MFPNDESFTPKSDLTLPSEVQTWHRQTVLTLRTDEVSSRESRGEGHLRGNVSWAGEPGVETHSTGDARAADNQGPLLKFPVAGLTWNRPATEKEVILVHC